jgi:hypothetical protein
MSVSANPLRFATSQSASLPAGVGKTVLVPVQANQPGSTGNLEKGAIQAIEGDLGLSLSVTNLNALEGGSDTRSPAPTETDRSLLRAALLKKIADQALAKFSAEAGSEGNFVPGSLQPGRIIAETDHPATAVAADRLDMDLKVEFTGLVVKDQRLRELAELNLDAVLPTGYQPVSTELEFSVEPSPADAVKPGLSIRASRKIEPVIDLSAAGRAVLGFRPDEAASRLRSLYHLERLPTVRLNPVWWPRLPWLAFQVAVTD